MNKICVVALAAVLLTGCVQENNPRNVRLGSVSLGQQLIDLKAAHEDDAISSEEYTKLKNEMVALSTSCVGTTLVTQQGEEDSGDDESEDESEDGWSLF